MAIGTMTLQLTCVAGVPALASCIIPEPIPEAPNEPEVEPEGAPFMFILQPDRKPPLGPLASSVLFTQKRDVTNGQG
jgi:hypothetical protein